MASREGYVTGAGQAQNYADGVSRALLTVGDNANRRYNVDREIALRKAAEAENKRRYELNQDRLDRGEVENKLRYEAENKRKQQDHDHKFAAIKARKDLGTFVTDGNVEGKYTLEDHSVGLQKRFKDNGDKLNNGKAAFEKYLTGENSEAAIEEAMRAYDKYNVPSNNAADVLDNRAGRKESYARLVQELRFVKGPKAKADLISKISDSVYGEAISNLQKDMASGRYLSKNERHSAVMRRLPENISQYLDTDYITKQFGDRAGGMTNKEIVEWENKRVTDHNRSALAAQTSKLSAYSRGIKSAGKFKSSDLKDMAKMLGGVDAGYWDNQDVVDAADHMLSENIHPQAIVLAIQKQLKAEDGPLTQTFIDSGDEKQYKSLITYAKDLSDKMQGSGGSSLVAPSYDKQIAARTVDQIMYQSFQKYRAGKLAPHIPKDNRQKVLDASLLPPEFERVLSPRAAEGKRRAAAPVSPLDFTPAPEVGKIIGSNYSYDVPLPDDYQPSAQELKYLRGEKERVDKVAEDWGVAGTAKALLGSVPAIAGFGLGSVRDIAYKLSDNHDSKLREAYARNMTFMQPTKEEDPAAYRNMKWIADTLGLLPPTIAPSLGRLPVSRVKNTAAVLSRPTNKAHAKARAEYSRAANIEASKANAEAINPQKVRVSPGPEIPRHVKLEAEAARADRLILNDQYSAAFSAHKSGKPTKVVKAPPASKAWEEFRAKAEAQVKARTLAETKARKKAKKKAKKKN